MLIVNLDSQTCKFKTGLKKPHGVFVFVRIFYGAINTYRKIPKISPSVYKPLQI